jgi:trk system potassium uptake protein
MTSKEKKITSGYPLILNYLGIFAILIGIINLFPLIVLAFYPEELDQALFFVVPGIITILIGLLINFFFRGAVKGRFERHQDAILVVLIWILAIFASAMPFILTGDYNLTQAVFETSSGYSTTGLTVVNVTVTPKIFLFFRSWLQFVGGIGLVLVLTAAISDKFGMRLYNTEGHTDKLVPNLIRSGRIIILIYVGYIFAGFILYMIFGMSPFDAINHAMCAVATGGFSTQAGSIASYNSLAIEIVTMVLMILGGTNFLAHLMLLSGKFKNFFSHIEIKSIAIIILIATVFSVLILTPFYGGSFSLALRHGSFQFISAITGTGYQSIPSFLGLPAAFYGILVIGMIMGAGVGSTCGGMKQYRVALAFKSLFWSVKDQLFHKNIIRKHYINKLGNKMVVDKDDISQNYAFLQFYIIVLIVGTLIFSAFGYSLEDSLFEFASALGTVGLSVGITGYNAHPLILWTSTLGMFLGRLEFYVIFIAVSKMFIDLTRKKVNRHQNI